MTSKKEIIPEYFGFGEINFMMSNKYKTQNHNVPTKVMENKIDAAVDGNESYYEQIFNSRVDAILVLNNKNEIVDVNEGFVKMFQYSVNEVTGRRITDLIVPENLIKESVEINDKLDSGLGVIKETIRKRKDGHLLNLLIRGSKLVFKNSLPGKYIIYTDISSNKKSEEQIKASLVEKEVLLKEIHHRVKNNLQIISSLLHLQSRKIKDKDSISMFLNCQNRIKSISLIHEKMYQTNDLSRIDFGKYLKNLVYHLFNSFGIKSEQILLSIKSENIFMTMDTAISCGLIINELITNSLKHAFPDNKKGKVSIEVQYQGNNQFLLKVSDNGVGLPENIDTENSKSLGLQLVHTFVKQLEASLEISRDNGTEYSITFSFLKRSGGE